MSLIHPIEEEFDNGLNESTFKSGMENDQTLIWKCFQNTPHTGNYARITKTQ
tara:strand:+ start:248 stop:403 length:156 start_codon:yes stop_codon:yes gene_type:complete